MGEWIEKEPMKWSSNESVLDKSVLGGEKMQISTWVKELFLK